MAVSRSKRAANNKWDKENMKIIACKIRREQAERFAQYAEDNGTTVNNLLKNFVLEKIGDKKNEFEQTQIKPYFVMIFEEKIVIDNDKVVIPLKIKNIGNGTAVNISLVCLDNNNFVSCSLPEAKHSVYRYLSQYHAQRNEFISVSFVCYEKVQACNLFFSIDFYDIAGNKYRQDFRMQYGFNSEEGFISENYTCENPVCIE